MNFNPSIVQHSGIRGTTDEAVLKRSTGKRKKSMTYLQYSTCCCTECMQGSPMFACAPDEKKASVHATQIKIVIIGPCKLGGGGEGSSAPSLRRV